MTVQIYSRGNYIFYKESHMIDPLTDACGSVLVAPKSDAANDFYISGPDIGARTFALADVRDENMNPYTLEQWLDFYTQNTGFKTTTGGSVVVDNVGDLPSATEIEPGIWGIILKANKSYFFDNVDLNGLVLVGSENTTIIGASSETAFIRSTGKPIGYPFFSTIYTTPIRHVTFIDFDNAISIDGQGLAAYDWTGVNFTNCLGGEIKNVSNFIFNKGAFINCVDFKFDGTVQTASFETSLFTGNGDVGSAIKIMPTTTVTRRFRFLFSAFTGGGDTFGIDFSDSATIPAEKYILDNVDFSGIANKITGVDHTSNKSLFTNCVGITNSSKVGGLTMHDNATPTVIGVTETYYKIEGTTIALSLNSKFEMTSNNELTYTGLISGVFEVIAISSLSSGNNNELGVAFGVKKPTDIDFVIQEQFEAKATTTGLGKAENVTFNMVTELSSGDKISAFVENYSGLTDVISDKLVYFVKPVKG